jgi:hypothetical protein
MEQERQRQPSSADLDIPVKIEQLDIEKFIGLMTWAEQQVEKDELGEPLDEWVWHDALIAHPEVVGDLYRALANHPLPGLRQTAALGLKWLYQVDPEAAIELWPKLLGDSDSSTQTAAQEDIANAVYLRVLPINALYRIFSGLEQAPTDN